jgi:redox-sensing transcriptional repressor
MRGGKRDKPIAGTDEVPKAVVSRLSLYLRELQRWLRAGQDTISSTQLGKTLGLSDSQVRKDLAYFGQFGYPGRGYRCDELIQKIKRILGTDKLWPVAVVGLGNLGRALLGYRGFTHQGFQIVVGFDIDVRKIDQPIDGVPIHHLRELPEVARQRGIRLAILAVPASAAQEVADQIVAAGIEGLLNFAPVSLTLPASVNVVSVDLAVELEQLSFAVVKRASREAGQSQLDTRNEPSV